MSSSRRAALQAIAGTDVARAEQLEDGLGQEAQQPRFWGVERARGPPKDIVKQAPHRDGRHASPRIPRVVVVATEKALHLGPELQIAPIRRPLLEQRAALGHVLHHQQRFFDSGSSGHVCVDQQALQEGVLGTVLTPKQLVHGCGSFGVACGSGGVEKGLERREQRSRSHLGERVYETNTAKGEQIGQDGLLCSPLP